MLTIYKASAGSGKTFTLAYTYIKSLLGVKTERGAYVLNTRKYAGDRYVDYAHAHILAITFTNKATAEMKSRIIKELDRLSQVPTPPDSDTPYAAMLIKDLRCSRDEIAQVATHALHRILNDYNNFNVSTIDSFFQTVLRSFAREIDRQGDYRVELNDSLAVDTAVSMLFDEVNGHFGNPDDPVANWLQNTAEECWAQGTDFNPFNRAGSVFRRITSFVQKTFDEDFKARAEQITEYLKNPQALVAFNERLKGLVEECDKQVIEAAQNIQCSLCGVNKSVCALVERAAEGQLTKDDCRNILNPSPKLKYLQALRSPENDDSLKTLFGKNGAPSPDNIDALLEWFSKTVNALMFRGIYAKMRDSLVAFKALTYINEYINRFRQENNLILIADTNTLIGTIIAGSDAPFIYERVGVSLNKFLIDEFQDTSTMQWNNIKPLIANSLSEEHDSLIIGDVKQSIYRWRGGDASLLDQRVQKDDFPMHCEVKGAREGENTNYRSAGDIVRFNNTIFKSLATAGKVTGYDGVAQSIPDDNRNIEAYITISDLLDKDQYASMCEDFTDGELAACKDDDENLIPARIAIVRCGKAIVAEHARGYRWKDIAVLCRRNVEATMVAELFAQLFPEIELISDEALIVGHASSVRLVVSILRMLATAAPANVAEQPVSAAVSSLKADVLVDRFEYFRSRGFEPSAALRRALDVKSTDDADSIAMRGDLSSILADAPATLPALVEAIIARKVPADVRAAELPYINAFVDTVIEFSTNYIPTVNAFLDYWDSVSDTLAIGAPEGADAVTIMTVHKAKGLEWDCVHIPILNWEFKAAPAAGWYSLDKVTEIDESIRPPLLYLSPDSTFALDGSPFASEIEEGINKDSADNLNVAYVAFTRAVRELHIGVLPKRGDSIGGYIQGALNASGTEDDLFLDLSKGVTADSCNYCLGEPTKPIVKSKSATTRPLTEPTPIPAAPFNVAFTAVNSAITRVEDITVSVTNGPDIDSETVEEYALTTAEENTRTSVDERLAEATRRGTDMHAILAQMISLADLDGAIGRVAGDDSTRAAEYRAVITAALDARPAEVEQWFGPEVQRVLNEQTIYDGHGCNYRPDRIVWTADGHIDIVDFKFTSETSDEHRQQVCAYVSMLKQMGYEDVRGYLWYLLRNEVVQA